MGEPQSTELVQRIAAAAVLIPVALGAVYLGGWAFSLLAALAAALMACEWENVTGGSRTGRHTVLNVVAALISLLAVSMGRVDVALVVIGAGALAAFTIPRHDGARSWWPALGIIAVALPAVCLVWMRGGVAGFTVVVWLLVVLWATDSGAYFAGKKFGGARLAPRISPGKTWAGSYGGTTAGALVGVVLAVLIQDVSAIRAVLASVFVSVVGQGGDIAISAVKRRFGVKDMGALIPGHGGVLDRLDSLLFAAVAVSLLAVMGGGTVPLWR